MCSYLYTAITFLVLDSVLSFDFDSNDYEINYFPYVIIIYYQGTLISRVLITYVKINTKECLSYRRRIWCHLNISIIDKHTVNLLLI